MAYLPAVVPPNFDCFGQAGKKRLFVIDENRTCFSVYRHRTLFQLRTENFGNGLVSQANSEHSFLARIAPDDGF